jgi:ZIP family zinc transporter
VIEAAVWGAIGASMLLVGAVLAFAIDIPPRIRGLILAFGAGALFGAVAYELFEDAVAASMGGLDVLVGFASGAVAFYAGSVLIDRLGGRGEASADGGTRMASRRDPRNDGLGVVLGSILDGIPESVVLGASLIGGTGVGIPVLVAIAVSNIPEGLSATEDLSKGGFSRGRIATVWLTVVAASTLAAAIGFAVLSTAGQSVTAFVDAFAAGAILAMLAETMIPEAYEIGGRAVGLATALGFGIAASLSFLA